MRHLAQNSEWLQLQQMQYADIADDFETKFFYETAQNASGPDDQRAGKQTLSPGWFHAHLSPGCPKILRR